MVRVGAEPYQKSGYECLTIVRYFGNREGFGEGSLTCPTPLHNANGLPGRKAQQSQKQKPKR